MKIRSCLSVVIVVMVVLGAAASADAHTGRRMVLLPSHLSVGDQYYDASIAGLRSYMASIRETDAELHAKLLPDLQRLETRAITAGVLFGASILAGVGTMVYAGVSRTDCPSPSVTDPNFSMRVDQWSACNQNDMNRSMTIALIGLGTMAVGSLTALVIAPRRSDYFDFMNRHNSMSPQPIRFNLGYDPHRRFALAGATLTF